MSQFDRIHQPQERIDRIFWIGRKGKGRSLTMVSNRGNVLGEWQTMSSSVSNLEEIKSMISQLPAQDLIALLHEIEERLQTEGMMQLAESGFQEWDDEDENIYDV